MFISVSLHWLGYCNDLRTGRGSWTDTETQPFIVKDSVIYYKSNLSIYNCCPCYIAFCLQY